MDFENFIRTNYPDATASEKALIREVLSIHETEQPTKEAVVKEFSDFFTNFVIREGRLEKALKGGMERQPHLAVIHLIQQCLAQFLNQNSDDTNNTTTERPAQGF